MIKITTSKKVIFKSMPSNSWLDTASNIIWHDIEIPFLDHYEAVERFDSHLPSKAQFLEGEDHGFREVLPNISHWFWTNTIGPGSDYYAYYFNGINGEISYTYRNSHHWRARVRTVEKSS